MGEVTDLEVIRASKKEYCQFCGKDVHKTWLCCPRIAQVEIDEDSGSVTGVSFWGDFFEADPTDAA